MRSTRSVSSEEVPHHKPAPDIFLEAARRLGVEPGGCLVYEDTDPGIEAARSCRHGLCRRANAAHASPRHGARSSAQSTQRLRHSATAHGTFWANSQSSRMMCSTSGARNKADRDGSTAVSQGRFTACDIALRPSELSERRANCAVTLSLSR